MSWLAHLLGIDNEAGRWYAFWSGFGSDMSEVTLIGLAFGAYHRHNCHQRRCWRIGRHTVDGTPWCDRHHEAARGESEGA
jgi:hypothetical protein